MRRYLFSCLMIVVLVGIMSTVVMAAEPGNGNSDKPVADEMIGATGITWMPKVSYGQLSLSLSRPDGTVFSKTFTAGGTPYLDLSTILGKSDMDGSYTYELRVIPQIHQRVRRDGTGYTGEESEKPGQELVQSGHFMVRGGALFTSVGVEPGERSSGQDDLSRTQDLCYQDDMVIQFSLCVGLDCVCNMNFGFDTIVLKENNLRIFFDDTSASSGFPFNDWRIICNDSTSGGASYFSVEDSTAGKRVFSIEAGAPTNSLYVDDGGKIGIGTSTPTLPLHISYCDTPAIRLDQNGSCGWTAQAWDVAGNEANFFIRDVTNGGRLPFRIRPNAPANSFFIKGDGCIGFGTDAPGFPLHLVTNSTTNAAIVSQRTGGATNFINATATLGVFGTTTDHHVRFVRNTQPQMDLIGNSDITMADGGGYNGTWNPASSRDLKENITRLTLDEAEVALEGLNPVKYNYKDDKTEPRVGFIAEDVPELVAMNGRKTLGTVDIIAVLTKMVQQQQEIQKQQQLLLQQQQKTIDELQKEIAELKKR